jgi:DNA-binding NtrC family response regulator
LTAESSTLPRGTVLIVDDEASVRLSLRSILEETYRVLEAEDGHKALQVLSSHTVDLVLLDQRMPGATGIDVLEQIKALDPTIVVVLATAVRDLKTVVEAMKRGAYDYITKPFDVEDVLLLVGRALEKRALERQVLCLRAELTPAGTDRSTSFSGIVGRHPEMAKIYQRISHVAATPTTVLITGESGTGKELIARAIHNSSPRSAQPFVAFNVAAYPESLIDAELFGYERGAFTGATVRKAGKFELAHGGTVFLDEIGSLRPDLQTKLLRVLQERQIERLGGLQPTSVDIRIVAATNADLRKAVKERTFREDLYYRLHVVEIQVPPLRERREDIPLLVDHFVGKFARECNKTVRGVSKGARDLLSRYDWPGNIRELENIIQRAVVLTDGPVLQLQDFPLEVAMPHAGARLTEETGLPLKEACEQFERQYVLRVLDQMRWNVSAAARMLGVHRNTIVTKLTAWGLHRPGGQADRADVS